ncbi:MAG: N(4)-(beta-N-acetylglucosaminyl)-L-asparaginase [Planctomycetota bacterium]
MKSIASHNGLNATQVAFKLLADYQSSLHACVEGVTVVEDDPDEHTVGYGGFPNELGIVELDAAVMDGMTHRVGAVAGLRNVRHAARVAKCVLEQTHRVLLVGEGALNFARQQGFVEENLLTDKARRMWLYWKRRLDSRRDDWIKPADDEDLDVKAWFEKTFYKARNVKPGGTVHCAAVDSNLQLAAATTTSGHPFKLPGRVGDSPIAGAGLYVDNEVGSCGSIGHGEATMQNCTSFLAVELMRNGMSPREAGLAALERLAEKSSGSYRDESGNPDFDVQLFLLSRDGEHAGVALRGHKQIAVTDEDGTRLENCVTLC